MNFTPPSWKPGSVMGSTWNCSYASQVKQLCSQDGSLALAVTVLSIVVCRICAAFFVDLHPPPAGAGSLHVAGINQRVTFF